VKARYALPPRDMIARAVRSALSEGADRGYRPELRWILSTAGPVAGLAPAPLAE